MKDLKEYSVCENEGFLKKAQDFKRELMCTEIAAKGLVKPDGGCEPLGGSVILDKGESILVDFGDHFTGYLSFNIDFTGYPPDAPAYIRVKLCERACETAQDSRDYNGWLCSSWIQEEYIHVDRLPSKIELPRRYAFRYAEIKVLDLTYQYKVRVKDFKCKAVSAADMSAVPELCTDDARLRQLDRIAVKTLAECMQDVFEDGPKRDRRLWIGDLRLQALVNYVTFKNYDIVKRCLYLFAGSTLSGGMVGSCMYTEPKPVVGAVDLFDYSLIFISCLYDYYEHTGDTELVSELYGTALRQAEIAAKRLDERGIVRDSDDWWCFLDWNSDLNKQAGAQGVFIYALRQLAALAGVIGEPAEDTQRLIDRLCNAAKEHLWDEKLGLFVSGDGRQVSCQSQIWLVLAEVFDKAENRKILARILKDRTKITPVTPYCYHYFVEALMKNDMKAEARQLICDYWGAMADDGADCFYEAFDPENKDFSPYGSDMVNSYCHAWSCTPAYFIRKYF